MAKNIKRMINNVGEGDFAAAQVAFDAALVARRESQIANYKTTIAQNSFQPPEPHPGQDTGITGAPDEIGEALSAVDQATMAHAKGDIAKSKAILKARAKAKAAEKLGKEVDAATMAHARDQ